MEFRSFTVLISCAHPYHEYCLHEGLPSIPIKDISVDQGRSGRKLCRLVLQLLSLTSPGHYLPGFFRVLQHLSPCISHFQDPFSSQRLLSSFKKCCFLGTPSELPRHRSTSIVFSFMSLLIWGFTMYHFQLL